MEGVFRPTAETSGIAEWPDDFHELHERSGPSVREDDWQGLRVLRPHMQEMNSEAVDSRAELREGVGPSLEAAPVVLVAPVGDQRLGLVHGNTLRPVAHGCSLRPPRRR